MHLRPAGRRELGLGRSGPLNMKGCRRLEVETVSCAGDGIRYWSRRRRGYYFRRGPWPFPLPPCAGAYARS